MEKKAKEDAEAEECLRRLQEQTETPQAKRERLLNLARQRIEEQERKTTELREALLEKRFRENCEPLRTALSQKLAQKTMEELRQQVRSLWWTSCLESWFWKQMAEHMKRDEEEKQLRHQFDLMNETERIKREERFGFGIPPRTCSARYQTDVKKRYQKREQFVHDLDEQMKIRSEEKRTRLEAESEDVERLREKWMHQEKEEAEQKMRALEKKRSIAEALKNANLEMQNLKEERRRQKQCFHCFD